MRLLDELLQMSTELERLITAVNLTNAASSLPDGQTVTAALAKRDVLAVRQGVLRSAAEAVTQAQARYSRSEIRLARQLDVAAVRKEDRRSRQTAPRGGHRDPGAQLDDRADRRRKSVAAPVASTKGRNCPKVASRSREGTRWGFNSPTHCHAPHRHRATCTEHGHHQMLS